MKNGPSPVLDLLETTSFRPLADALRQCSWAIVRRWEALVREYLPAADKLTLAQVRDEVPATLARLADALASDSPEETRRLIGQTSVHGSERFHQGYNVDELIVEYRLLRRVLIEEVESYLARRTSKEEDLVLSMGVDTVLQQGVVTFVNYQRREIRAAVDAEEKFLTYIAHDLRNQLNNVNLSLQLITTELEETSAVTDQLGEIKRVQRAIFDTVEGMDRLLKSARVRHGTAQIHLAPVEIHSLVQGMVGGFEREAVAKKLRLVVDVPADMRYISDRQLLLIILHNLVGNAIKYSDAGTITVSASADDRGGLCLSVFDEGPGIAPEMQEKVFREFERGESAGLPGLGLGLAIAARAAKLLQAELIVESTLGKGSVFRLRCAPVARNSSHQVPE